MEKEQVHHIIKNLDILLACTTFNEEFVCILKANKMLDSTQLAELGAKATAEDVSRRLYQIILRRAGSYHVLLEALEQTKQLVAASVIKRYADYKTSLVANQTKTLGTVQRITSTICISFNVRSASSLYTGRNEELKQLFNIVTKRHEEKTNPYQITCIVGLGGIGKTELVKKLFENLHSDFYDKIWLCADTEHKLSTDLKKLQEGYLGMPADGTQFDVMDIKISMQNIYKYFSHRETRSLIVLDNLLNNSILQKVLPSNTKFAGSNPVELIITSRYKNWPNCREVIEVADMNELDAVQLVKKGLSVKYNNGPDPEILVETLHYLPVALQQAVAYILQQNQLRNYSIQVYLNGLNENPQALLDTNAFPNDVTQSYMTVFTLWDCTLAEICSKHGNIGNLANQIFEMLAYFNFRNIPTTLFLNIDNYSEEQVYSAINLLHNYSMVTQNLNLLTINKLVQKVMQAKLKNSCKGESVIKSCLNLFTREKITADNIEHGLSVWTHATAHSVIVNSHSSFPCKLIKHLKQSCRYAQCLQFAESTLTNLQKVVDYNNSSAIQITCMTAEIHHLKGNYKTAIQMYNNVIRMLLRKTATSETELEILSIQHKIGQTMHLQGNYKEALQILDEVIERRQTSFVTDECAICDVLHTQISSLIFTGDYKLALEKSKRVLECYSRVLGADSKKVLCFCQDIAVVHGEMGNVTHAVSLLADIYEKMKIKFGPESRYTVRCGHNLALYLTRSGKHKESLNLFTQIYQLKKRVEGDNHPTTMLTLESMAEVLINMKEYEKALYNLHLVHPVYCELYGENNPKTAVCQLGIGIALSGQGRINEALKILKNILEVLKSEFGEERDYDWQTMVETAIILETKKNYSGALQILENVGRSVSKNKASTESNPIFFQTELLIATLKNILENQPSKQSKL